MTFRVFCSDDEHSDRESERDRLQCVLLHAAVNLRLYFCGCFSWFSFCFLGTSQEVMAAGKSVSKMTHFETLNFNLIDQTINLHAAGYCCRGGRNSHVAEEHQR